MFPKNKINQTDTLFNPITMSDTIKSDTSIPHHDIPNSGVNPGNVVDYALTLLGTPYKYGSTDPAIGFDCSGFITYVFRHFNIAVPRSSIEFTNVGTPVDVSVSKRGDIILFTGTDSTERNIGHIGIVVSNENGKLQFIHSTSGKAYGVVITELNQYYKGRFIKIVRVFP